MAPGFDRAGKALFLSLLIAGCGGGDGSSTTSLTAALQDLNLDPSGRTTVLSFTESVGALATGHVDADGGQSAQSVTVSGSSVTVVWDERVTPTHHVRILGYEETPEDFVAVDTSDDSVPSFVISSGTQNAGLGGDVIVAQFSGPRVAPEQAEDPASWTLRVGGQVMDLSGSVFTLAESTQTLTATLGTQANLHAAFELSAASLSSVADVAVATSFQVGAASGDSSQPSVVSAVQNLTQDEFGHVVDFTFDEDMDPVFATGLSLFDAGGFPVFASSVEQVTGTLLRATFTEPMVPQVDSVDLSANMVDAHGNQLSNPGVIPITQGAPVANAFEGSPQLRTVENAGGDTLEAVFVQALDPADAEDPAHWSLDVDSSSVDLALQALSYDIESKTLSIGLIDDHANGDSFDFAPAGGNEPRDIDGDFFVESFSGVVAGDVVEPSVDTVVQNRDIDPAGMTLDVSFSEDVEQASAETLVNYAASGGLTVLSATQQAGSVVRLVLDGLAVPGDVTLTTSAVVDLAGTAMSSPLLESISSSDTDDPVASFTELVAEEGPDNDRIVLAFDDSMIQIEVEQVSNWSVESPVGNARDTSNASISYNTVTKTAVMTFDGGDGVNFQLGDDVQIALSSMRDIGGNAADTSPILGAIRTERNEPKLEVVWVETATANHVHVQFSEPMQFLDDVHDAVTNPTGQTVYGLFDASQTQKGALVSATPDADLCGVELVFSAGAVAGIDTLEVRGLCDLAGNSLFPRHQVPIQTEDSAAPSLNLGLSAGLTVSGEDNDRVTVEFARSISRNGAEDQANYTLMLGVDPVDLSNAELSFDGDRTVVIDLNSAGSGALQNAAAYTLSTDNLRSVQGVAMASTSADTVVPGGDVVAPDMPEVRTRIDAADAGNSVLLEMDEAVDVADLANVANVDILGANPDSAAAIGLRTGRSTWAIGVSPGQVVNVNCDDLAGNASGLVSRAIQTADTNGPSVVLVQGLITEGLGGDRVSVEFDHPVDPISAMQVANYTVSQGGFELDLNGAFMRYQSSPPTAFVVLPLGLDLDANQAITVQVDNVLSQSGLVISPPANVAGSVSGDSTAPSMSQAFVNYRLDAGGLAVEVVFNEDVDPALVSQVFQWSVESGQSVLAVDLLHPDRLVLTLSSPLIVGDDISITGVLDAANNAAATITIEPSI